MALFDFTTLAREVGRVADALEKVIVILDRAFPPPIEADPDHKPLRVTRANPMAIRARQDIERTLRQSGLPRHEVKARADQILKARVP